MKAHSIRPGMTSASTATEPTVSAALSQLEKRLARSQPMTPVLVSGAGRSASISARLRVEGVLRHRSTSAMRLLYQFMKADVSRLSTR